jgi:hypothetical protein
LQIKQCQEIKGKSFCRRCANERSQFFLSVQATLSQPAQAEKRGAFSLSVLLPGLHAAAIGHAHSPRKGRIR